VPRNKKLKHLNRAKRNILKQPKQDQEVALTIAKTEDTSFACRTVQKNTSAAPCAEPDSQPRENKRGFPAVKLWRQVQTEQNQ